ncbi:MAG: hypothetical protein IKU84_07095 [Clostridia bacterium]|nr:hypothetical protein [Clostridia bacterium]
MKKTFIKIVSAFMAMLLFFSLCGCKSSDYKDAVAAYESGDYATAVSILSRFKDYDTYKDAQLIVHKIMASYMDKYGSKGAEAIGTFTPILTSIVRSTISNLTLVGSASAKVDTSDSRWILLQSQREEIIKIKEEYDAVFTRDVIKLLSHDTALFDTHSAFSLAHSSILTLTSESGCQSAVYTTIANSAANSDIYGNLKSPLDTCEDRVQELLNAAKKLKK